MLSITRLFIGTAYAQDAGASASPSSGGMDLTMLMNYVPLLLIFGVFYVLIIRPQQKKMDEQARMIKALQPGDVVLTNSGIHGKITKILDGHIFLEIAEGVHVKMVPHFISGHVNKQTVTPANQDGKK